MMTLEDVGRAEKLAKECYDRLFELIGEYRIEDVTNDDIREMVEDILKEQTHETS